MSIWDDDSDEWRELMRRAPIPVVTNVSCPACKGFGRVDGLTTWPPAYACRECNGTGYVWRPIKEPA